MGYMCCSRELKSALKLVMKLGCEMAENELPKWLKLG
jgi:hypothetical protein